MILLNLVIICAARLLFLVMIDHQVDITEFGNFKYWVVYYYN